MLIEPIFAHARATPSDIAITDDFGQYTYQQIAAMVAGLGMYIAQQTTRPNVGLLLPTGMGFVASFYGTLLAGKTVVPINFLLGDREVGHVIQNSEIDTVITIPQLGARLANTPLKVIDLTQLPKTPPAMLEPKIPEKSPDDLAVLMYTSGTAGLPKGVMLTYNNLHSDVQACIEAANLQQKHKFLGVIPLFHAFGMTAMMLAPIELGSPVVYMARFNPAATIEALRKHQASIIFGVPSMFGAMLHVKNATPDDFKSIYAIISGGEPLSSVIREGFPKRFGIPVYEGYGLTETSPVVSLNSPVGSKPGSIGKPLPGVKVRIIDENGNDLPAGQEGEIWLGGPMVMKGYYKMPDETAALLTADGFLKTGDLGKLDEDGFLYITGRKKDLIIVAGEKVAPREVEEILLRSPAIAEAAVVGRKDPTRGEVVVAFVVPAPEKTVKPDELRAFCRDQGLPLFKIPRDIVVTDQLPRSPTGKVLKRVLAEQAATPAT